MARRDGNDFWSVKPVKFIPSDGEVTGWSQSIRRLAPEKSLHWDERKKGGFRRGDVYPCSEGFPGVVGLGPVDSGMPIIFEVILANGEKTRGIVSSEQIDGAPSWLVTDEDGGSRKKVSYYEVAGWSSVEGRDLPLFEKILLKLIRNWPGR